jgi:hypothetical protein
MGRLLKKTRGRQSRATVPLRVAKSKNFRLVDHPPDSPHLAPADFFPSLNIKKQLASKTLTQETFKILWAGAVGRLLGLISCV